MGESRAARKVASTPCAATSGRLDARIEPLAQEESTMIRLGTGPYVRMGTVAGAPSSAVCLQPRRRRRRLGLCALGVALSLAGVTPAATPAAAQPSTAGQAGERPAARPTHLTEPIMTQLTTPERTSAELTAAALTSEAA